MSPLLYLNVAPKWASLLQFSLLGSSKGGHYGLVGSLSQGLAAAAAVIPKLALFREGVLGNMGCRD